MKTLQNTPLIARSARSMLLFITAAVLVRCSPRIYRPPALGAEYQFDRGLPAAKKPSSLFGKKAEKNLSKQGILQETSKRTPASQKTAVRAKAPSGTKPADTHSSSQPAAADSLQHTDSLRHDTGTATPAPVDGFRPTKAPAAAKTK